MVTNDEIINACQTSLTSSGLSEEEVIAACKAARYSSTLRTLNADAAERLLGLYDPMEMEKRDMRAAFQIVSAMRKKAD